MKEILYVLTLILRLNGDVPEPQYFEVSVDGTRIEFYVKEDKKGAQQSFDLKDVSFANLADCELFALKLKQTIERSRVINSTTIWLGNGFGINDAGAGESALDVSHSCSSAYKNPLIRPASQSAMSASLF